MLPYFQLVASVNIYCAADDRWPVFVVDEPVLKHPATLVVPEAQNIFCGLQVARVEQKKWFYIEHRQEVKLWQNC